MQRMHARTMPSVCCPCAAYWLEEGGAGRAAQASELLGEAHAILGDFRAAPQLQADIRAAHEVPPFYLPKLMCSCAFTPSPSNALRLAQPSCLMRHPHREPPRMASIDYLHVADSKTSMRLG